MRSASGRENLLRTAHGETGGAHADHRHAEGMRAPRDAATDVAEPHHGEGTASQALGDGVAQPAPLALGPGEDGHVLGDPQAPSEHVLDHPRPEDAGGAGDHDVAGQRRDQRPVDAGSHDLQPAEAAGVSPDVRGDLPREGDLGVADGRHRLVPRGGQADRHSALRFDERSVARRIVRVVDEDGDGAGGTWHCQDTAWRMRSSREKSISLRSRPSRRYQSNVWAIPGTREPRADFVSTGRVCEVTARPVPASASRAQPPRPLRGWAA